MKIKCHINSDKLKSIDLVLPQQPIFGGWRKKTLIRGLRSFGQPVYITFKHFKTDTFLSIQEKIHMYAILILYGYRFGNRINLSKLFVIYYMQFTIYTLPVCL